MENTARADADKPKADAELKDKVIVDKDEAKGDGDKPKEATIGDVLNAVKSLSDRVDAIEKGRGDNNEEKGEPEDLAADDADDDEEAKARRGALRKRTALERADASELSFKSEHLFYDWQARVDGVAGHYGAGHHAPKPMISETLRNYKIRCLRPWQNLSKAYADVDLKGGTVLQVLSI
jgi:hypothetical protein